MTEQQDQLNALYRRYDVTDEGEQLFVSSAYKAGALTVENCDVLLEAHRAGSMATYDSVLQREALRNPPGRAVTTHKTGGSATEREIAGVLSRHAARIATADLGVRMFRRSLLGSPTSVLPLPRARRLLASPALRYLSWGELRSSGVPLDGSHTSTIKQVGPGRVEVRVKWPGHSVVRLSEETRTRQFLIPGQNAPVTAEPRSFLNLLAGPGGHAWMIGSARGWSDADSAWFLLTGKAPGLEAMTVGAELHFSVGRIPTKSWITIKALPHVSPDSVRMAFAQEQLRLTGHRKGRSIESRSLAVLDFVEEQIVKHGRRPSFDQLMKLWNRKVRAVWRFQYPSRMEHYYRNNAARLFLSARSKHSPALRTLGDLERVLADRPVAPSYFNEDNAP